MTTISSKIYLNAFSGAVFDQGQENSCVANAICQAIRLQSREYHKDTGELARNQIYYDYRVVKTDPLKDSGAVPTWMLDVAKTVGIATQASAAPYGGTVGNANTGGTIIDTTSPVYQAPTASARASANSEKVLGYTDFTSWLNFKNGDPTKQIDYDFSTSSPNRAQQQASLNSAIDTQLMHGKAVIIGANIPMWLSTEPAVPLDQQDNYYDWIDGSAGGHAFLIVGRDDSLNGGSYIVENSWSSRAGDHGYYTIPYQFITGNFIVNNVAVVDGFKDTEYAWTKERGDLSSMYVGLLGRAADHTGMEFWANAEKSGVTLSSIANSFVTSSEGTQKYGALSNSAYVNQLFTNMTGHTASSTALSTWNGKLAAGMSRADVGLGIIDSLLKSTGADHDTLVNRSTVSEMFAVTYQLDGPLTEAAAAISSVTSNADSVQIALTGVQHDLGWLAANQSTFGFAV